MQTLPRRARTLLAAISAALLIPQNARSQPTDHAATPAAGQDIMARDKLTGDWLGVRTSLENRGIRLEPSLVTDFSKNVRGGRDTAGSAFRHLFLVSANVDFKDLLGWQSGELHLDFQNQTGQSGSDEVGDFQFVDNLDADGRTQLSQVWYQYSFLDDTLRTKVGKIDANAEFAVSALGGEFVHGSASFPATDAVMPTYPDPSVGVCVFYEPETPVSFGVGVFDGALQEGIHTGDRGISTVFGPPADLFIIGEIAARWCLGSGRLPGRIAFDTWHGTGTFTRFDGGGTEEGTTGYTILLDQKIWTPDAPEEGEEAEFEGRGVGVFLMYDYADPSVLPADHHVNAGLTWRGPMEGRDRDLFGVMVSWIHFANDPSLGFTDNYEMATEVMYKAYITPSLTIQPYTQYIVNPGGADLNDALNIGFRVSVDF